MKKFLIGFFLFFILFLETSPLSVYLYTSTAEDNFNDIHIISRKEWWADESYRYLDNPYWVNVIKKNEEIKKTYTDEDLAQLKKDAEKRNEIDNYIMKNNKQENELASVIKEENGHKLLWPIQKTKYVKWIIIHHTDTFYETSLDSMRKIYKFHALTRGWGDIWYNYLIWYDWEIYEWRAWWDYVVWAQALRNNRSTVWIALIWYYHDKELNDKQKKSLDKLVKYLVKKYGIDLSKKIDYHRDCKWKDCSFYIETDKLSPIIWHRDAWHTSCPWEKVYAFLDKLKNNNLDFSRWLNYVENLSSRQKTQNYKKNQEKLAKLDRDTLLNTIVETEVSLDKIGNKSSLVDNVKKNNLLDIKEIWFSIINSKYKDIESKKSYVDDEKNIKIKLSYPKNDFIIVSDWTILYNIKVLDKENKLFLWWRKISKITIRSVPKRWYLDIISWKRNPIWDTSWVVNDNKFRWNLILYVKDWDLIVVNELSLTNYLKWLWEVGNLDNPEKVKSIIVTARTYARFYIEKSRKFPWEDYDWVDDPDSFQNYLWYGFEKRSPNISKIVEETKDLTITYKWTLIKPWYFSKSDWKTISYLDYCNIKLSETKWKDFCLKESLKYPYLKSVSDPGGIWLSRDWHGVWLSWIWATYLAERWWWYKMIIEYFLKWVNVG